MVLSEDFYVGTYTNYVSQLSISANGDMNIIGTNDAGPNPSWLLLSKSGKYLFVANEVNDYNGEYSGAVASFKVADNGGLTLINRVTSNGANPCHLAVNDQDSTLYVSNYCSGTLTVLNINPDGSLTPPIQTLIYNETPFYDCEQGSHIHEVTFSGRNTVLVNDLGFNSLYEYNILSNGLLETTPYHKTVVAQGTGPRHSVIHPSYLFTLVINEKANTLTSFHFNSSTLTLGSEITTVSLLRPGENSQNMGAAEVQLSCDGRYVYGSNRDLSDQGRSSIAVFALGTDGTLQLIQHVDTLGAQPRHFNFFLDCSLLLVGNLRGNSVVSFSVNKTDGTLTPLQEIGIEAPTHLLSLGV